MHHKSTTRGKPQGMTEVYLSMGSGYFSFYLITPPQNGQDIGAKIKEARRSFRKDGV